MKRIAFSGKICSGKSTIANYIITRVGDQGQKISFADPIKKIARETFGMTTKNRELLQIIGATGRALDKNTWVNKLLETVKQNPNQIWVVDDLRFPNEAEQLKKNGFILVRITVDENIRKQRIISTYGKDAEQHLKRINDYSEKALDDYEFDEIWENSAEKNRYQKFVDFLKMKYK